MLAERLPEQDREDSSDASPDPAIDASRSMSSGTVWSGHDLLREAFNPPGRMSMELLGKVPLRLNDRLIEARRLTVGGTFTEAAPSPSSSRSDASDGDDASSSDILTILTSIS